MVETPREKWASWLGLFATLIPGMIVSGFMPKWNVLPIAGWVAVAAVGAAIAGAIATPLLVRGAISGAIMGVGVMLGLWLYVQLRTALLGDVAFLKFELAVGGLIGALPGFVLYLKWARNKEN